MNASKADSPEVLDGVQVGEVDPAGVGGGAAVGVLLHVQAVQAHVHAVLLLEQHNHLRAQKRPSVTPKVSMALLNRSMSV